LNLRPIWGDPPGLHGGDFVDDTRTAGGAKLSTTPPITPIPSVRAGPPRRTARNGDMFMNYMDYVEDEAMFMFKSRNQVGFRMHGITLEGTAQVTWSVSNKTAISETGVA